MQRILLFDGVCVFCNGAVRWLMARDPGARLRFAPLQGETAAALRARRPEIPERDETAVLVEVDGGVERVSLRTTAVLRALSALDTPWRHLAWRMAATTMSLPCRCSRRASTCW